MVDDKFGDGNMVLPDVYWKVFPTEFGDGSRMYGLLDPATDKGMLDYLVTVLRKTNTIYVAPLTSPVNPSMYIGPYETVEAAKEAAIMLHIMGI